MLYEEYLRLKEVKRENVYMLKKGNFYVTYDMDAIIINYLFKYKLKKFKKYCMVGFPVSIIERITDKFNELSVDYEVYELGDDIALYSMENEKNYYDLLLGNSIYNDREIIT